MTQDATSQFPEIRMEDDRTINVKFVSSAGDEVYFKTKYTTKLSKLQAAYASKVGKGVESIRFSFVGKPVNDNDTPGSLEMEENDVIDVALFMSGG